MATYGIYLYSIVEVIWCTPPKETPCKSPATTVFYSPPRPAIKDTIYQKLSKCLVDWCRLMLIDVVWLLRQCTININQLLYIYQWLSYIIKKYSKRYTTWLLPHMDPSTSTTFLRLLAAVSRTWCTATSSAATRSRAAEDVLIVRRMI